MNLPEKISKKVEEIRSWERFIPEKLKNTGKLRAFGLLKVPMILFVSPTVEELSDQKCVIKVPASFQNKNHVGSMYFGSLNVGAELAPGMLANKHILESKENITLLFKEFKAHYKKRPKKDVFFVCQDGNALSDLVRDVIASGERRNLNVKVSAFEEDLNRESCAEFEFVISLK